MGTVIHPQRSWVEEFSARGYRLTAQRRALLEIIDTSKEHLDAAALLKLAQARDSAIDRATVYRTLELLKKCKLQTGDDQIHLACLQCGKVEEPGSRVLESLKNAIAHERGFHISAVRMEAGGRCADCVQSAKQAE
jgi:Fe2+ or Zn2+ uptake regulation protein